ncbi:MAG: zf-HC2 domain-containing protein [Dehalococcoidia bacterium]|nr:zf-HC2 domain-containing protein [Dehalococcoidia bacterium]
MFKRKSECQRLKGMLSPYIDGQLSPSERERIEGHIEQCDACRRELESLRATANLLHRVPMVSPPRSFALAELAPINRRPVAFGALRAATAVAVLLLAFLFLGDALHLFGPGLIGEERLAQDTPEMLNGGEAAYQAAGYVWPVWQIEVALVAVVVVLAVATAILWQRRR